MYLCVSVLVLDVFFSHIPLNKKEFPFNIDRIRFKEKTTKWKRNFLRLF